MPSSPSTRRPTSTKTSKLVSPPDQQLHERLSETTITSDTPGITLTCEATSDGGTGSASVTRDATAPEVDVTGVQDDATDIVGADPEPGCSTTDALSGVTAQANVGLAGVDPDGTGEITATCDGDRPCRPYWCGHVQYSVLGPQEAVEILRGDVQAIVDAGEPRSGQPARPDEAAPQRDPSPGRPSP